MRPSFVRCQLLREMPSARLAPIQRKRAVCLNSDSCFDDALWVTELRKSSQGLLGPAPPPFDFLSLELNRCGICRRSVFVDCGFVSTNLELLMPWPSTAGTRCAPMDLCFRTSAIGLRLVGMPEACTLGTKTSLHTQRGLHLPSRHLKTPRQLSPASSRDFRKGENPGQVDKIQPPRQRAS